MTATWTIETVLALAPDAASAKAGQGLASSRKWLRLGTGDSLIWGECQGSGANPYQTKLDLEGPAFSCSCPSRKFPCKHGLGLMLVWVNEVSHFISGEPPAWVVSWKENREKKAGQAKTKPEQPPAPGDPAARRKREAARNAKVAAGFDDLSLWMSDLLRQGFASLGAKSRTVWDEQARRMIDAQAPGVARRLRQIDEMSFAGEGWQTALLDRLARVHLLGEGYRRQDELPPEVVEDVRATIGFPADLDAVRAGPGIRDHWQVIGRNVSVEDRLTACRTWLIGRDTGRPALLLDFTAGNKPLEISIPAGVVIDADLAYFPGSVPLRALIKERHSGPWPLGSLAGGMSIGSAFTAYGSALAKNPWLEFYPVILENVVLIEADGAWSIRDFANAVVPLPKLFCKGWHLLALEGGRPLSLCGEFDGSTFVPLGGIAGGRFLVLSDREGTSPQTSGNPIDLSLMSEATASALVGFDRRPPPAILAGDPIGGALSGLGTKEPASRLLSVAAAASLYGRVGRKPSVDPSPAPEPCPPDDLPECLPAQAKRLRRMLKNEFWQHLNVWTELLATSGRRVPADVLVNVLERLENQQIDAEFSGRILGRRGRWLAAKHPKWKKYAGVEPEDDPQRVWETGSLHERLNVLKPLRLSDPERCRELVVSTFATEPADTRAELLRQFTSGLSMDDEPFLEAALDDRGKEVRGEAAEILKKLPESRLCHRMIERCRGLLSWKRGMLGLGHGSLVVEPPAACDKAMLRDGVAIKSPFTNLGERAWWLKEIVSATPPEAIAKMLGVSPSEIVEASLKTEWKLALWFAWSVSAIRHGDGDWAEQLFDQDPHPPSQSFHPVSWKHLLAAVPQARLDAMLLRRLRNESDASRLSAPTLKLILAMTAPLGEHAALALLRRLQSLVVAERREFSDPASHARLQEWSGQRFDRKYHDHDLVAKIKELSAIIPMDLAEKASADMSEDDNRLAYASSYRALIEDLEFRRDMHREFAE